MKTTNVLAMVLLGGAGILLLSRCKRDERVSETRSALVTIGANQTSFEPAIETVAIDPSADWSPFQDATVVGGGVWVVAFDQYRAAVPFPLIAKAQWVDTTIPGAAL
jgi:hypothetical protein